MGTISKVKVWSTANCWQSIIRDPYVLEFLGLEQTPNLYEKDRVSGGKISSILEESWNYYKDETIFGEIPESIYVGNNDIENDLSDKITLSLLENAVGGR